MVNTVNKTLAVMTIASQVFLFFEIIQYSFFRKTAKIKPQDFSTAKV